MPVGSIRRGKLGIGTEVPEYEIGGGLKFINFFTVEGWTPKANTKNKCYQQGMEALSRLELALFHLQRHDFFEGIETDDGRESTGGFVQLFGYDGGRASPIGGDREWYGRIHMRFHVYSELKNLWF
jgi:hypothetical protein